MWPTGRSLPTPGLSHDIDNTLFHFRVQPDVPPPPLTVFIYTALFSEISSSSAELPRGWVVFTAVWWDRSRGSNWIAHSCEPHKQKSLYILNELLDSPSSDLLYFIFYWRQSLNSFLLSFNWISSCSRHSVNFLIFFSIFMSFILKILKNYRSAVHEYILI